MMRQDHERHADLAQIDGGHAGKRPDERQRALPERRRAGREDEPEERGVHPGARDGAGIVEEPRRPDDEAVRPLIGHRAETELGLGDDARHLLRHPAAGVVHLHHADERVDAVAHEQQRHQARQVVRAAHDRRRPEHRRHHRDIEHELRDAGERRARERVEHHRREVDDRRRAARSAPDAPCCSWRCRMPHHTSRAIEIGERGHADVEADSLRPGQKEQRRDRRLADDEELRDAPLRRRRRRQVNRGSLHTPPRLRARADRSRSAGTRTRARALPSSRLNSGSRADAIDARRKAGGVSRHVGQCVLSGVTSSAAPPAALVITARPHAIASAMTSPNGSGRVLACTTTSSARIAGAGGRNPVKPTRPPRPKAIRQRLQLLHRVLAAGRVVHRAADDVASDRHVGGNRRQRLQEDLVSLPAREGRHQADAHDGSAGGVRPARRSRSSTGPSGANVLQIHRVVHDAAPGPPGEARRSHRPRRSSSSRASPRRGADGWRAASA